MFGRPLPNPLSTDDAGCPLDLVIASGQPSTLSNSEMAHLKLYLRARVDAFLTNHPDHFVGIVQFGNGPYVACPMSNSKEDIFRCIEEEVIRQPLPYLQTEAGLTLAGRHLNYWYDHELMPNRTGPSFAVEGVLSHIATPPPLFTGRNFGDKFMEIFRLSGR